MRTALGAGRATRGLAVSGGGIGAVAGWRRGRVVASAVGHRPDAAAGPAGGAATGRDRDGWARAGVHFRAMFLVTGLLFGLAPSLACSQTRLHPALKAGALECRRALALSNLRRLLVGGELALALVLLIGAGLMLKSFWRMNARPDGVPAGEHSGDESHAFRPQLPRHPATTVLYRSGAATSRGRSGCAGSRHRYVTFSGRRRSGRRAPGTRRARDPGPFTIPGRRDTSARWECPC